MFLYNPSPWKIEDQFEGTWFVMNPGQKIEVDQECAKHIHRRKKQYGVVMVGSDDILEEKRKEGLQALLSDLKQKIAECRVFQKEIKEKNGGEVEEMNTQLPYFNERKKEVEKLLATKPVAPKTTPVKKTEVTHVSRNTPHPSESVS